MKSKYLKSLVESCSVPPGWSFEAVPEGPWQLLSEVGSASVIAENDVLNLGGWKYAKHSSKMLDGRHYILYKHWLTGQDWILCRQVAQKVIRLQVVRTSSWLLTVNVVNGLTGEACASFQLEASKRWTLGCVLPHVWESMSGGEHMTFRVISSSGDSVMRANALIWKPSKKTTGPSRKKNRCGCSKQEKLTTFFKSG